MSITQEELRSLLDYDLETGVFRWKVARNAHGGKVKVGGVAGHVRENGYVIIGLNGKVYRAHRLAWLYVYGEFPKSLLDHKDGVRANNAISNLREATHGENSQNMHRPHRDNTAGYLGVEWHKQTKKFAARISVAGKRKYLGLFDSAEQAHAAYVSEKTKGHPAWIKQ